MVAVDAGVSRIGVPSGSGALSTQGTPIHGLPQNFDKPVTGGSKPGSFVRSHTHERDSSLGATQGVAKLDAEATNVADSSPLVSPSGVHNTEAAHQAASSHERIQH